MTNFHSFPGIFRPWSGTSHGGSGLIEPSTQHSITGADSVEHSGHLPDASKRKAVSYKRLLELEAQLRTEVEELFTLSEQSDQPEVSDGLVVRDEIARREDRLARLAQAKAVLETRAGERAAAEQADYEEKMAQREERERTTGRRTGGRPPAPPVPGARSGDQYNFTDPESRIMKNPTDAGFEQDYNAQVAVDQGSLLIVGWALSNHPNDSQEAEPTLSA